MKTLHLWLAAAIVFCGTSSTFGQSGSSWSPSPAWYQSKYSSAYYRGQEEEGVPLPPGAREPSSGLLDFPDPPSTNGVPSVQGDSLAPPIPGSFPMDGSYPVNGGYPADGGIPMDSGIGLPESSTWNAFSP
ncbi:MAG: hypothetical protein KDL87_18295, partial [Verrucomicrobiae bacterium]|nr:hypothetical protein [Verrucomicrobiae bacterium]